MEKIEYESIKVGPNWYVIRKRPKSDNSNPKPMDKKLAQFLKATHGVAGRGTSYDSLETFAHGPFHSEAEVAKFILDNQK